jgi:Tfp pilus assembly protein PilV
MSSFYEPKSQKAFAGNVMLWVIVAVVFVGLIGIGLWAFGVVTAPWKGQGGAFKQQQSATNRVQKQEMFEQIAADFDGYLVKIQIAVQAAKDATGIDKELRQTELIGLRQTCVDAAQQFNAESRKYTSRVWKSAGLPANLDPTLCQTGAPS